MEIWENSRPPRRPQPRRTAAPPPRARARDPHSSPPPRRHGPRPGPPPPPAPPAERILASYGGAYDDPKLATLIGKTVDRLVAASDRPDSPTG